MAKKSPAAARPHFIKEWRKHRGLTQEELAEQIGQTPGSISQLENGLINYTQPTLQAIAGVLSTRPADLLRAPPSIDPASTEVPVMGYLGAGAEVEPDFEQVPIGGLDQVSLPFTLDDDLIAFKVRGTSMLPFYKDGAVIVVYREQKRPIEAFYGEEVAVRLEDGRRFIKTLMRGSSGVTLTSFNADPIENVMPVWIGEIFAAIPPSALRKVERRGGIQGSLRLKAG